MEILLDLSQAAAACSIDESTALRWIAEGIMPSPVLVDGLPRWCPETLDRWALAGCVTGKPLHHSEMHKIRKGWLEDSFRAGDARMNTLLELEIDES